MRVSYHADYYVELPPGHPFPMGKFPALKEILIERGVITAADITEPDEASWENLSLVHEEAYLDSLANGTISQRAQRKMGLPWKMAFWRRSRIAVQGTINAASMALESGHAANLAGGTHHAFPDHGQGFCVLNDVAVAIRVLRRNGAIQRALVVDLDVHQGNGTAAIFRDDPSVYTFSIHGESNFPARKERSSCDIGLKDGTDDDGYLTALHRHLPVVLAENSPDIVFYLAGVDPCVGDRYGRLALTPQGLKRRDRYVATSVQDNGVPITLLMSGGYATTAWRTAELHAIAYEQLVEVYETSTESSSAGRRSQEAKSVRSSETEYL